jgi:putative membrane protein insertion efficiency factor
MGTILIAIIKLYKMVLSPLLGDCCRFEPTCSEYAIQAIRTHGWLKGLLLGTGRILRCHPFNPGGRDPVPGTAEAQDIKGEKHGNRPCGKSG